MNTFADTSILVWGLVLLIGMPVLVVLFSEGIQWARKNDYHDYITPLTFLRNWVVPLGGISIVMIIAELDRSSLLVRVVDTVFWIAVINSFIAFTNVFFFADTDKETIRAKAPKLFLDILRFVFVLFGAAVVVSQVWDVDLTGLLTALGVGSVVIGLALQDTLGSIFSGIALLSARQFKVGDWIRVAGNEGKVTSMTWRSVTMAARSGDTVVLPNTVLARDRVVNFGVASNWHSELVDFHFALDHPPELVKRVLTEAAMAIPVVLRDPPPDARIKEYTNDGVHYQGRLFLPSYQPVPITRSEYQCMVWYHAQRAGLHFPARYHRLDGLPRHLAVKEYRTVEERVELLEQVHNTYGTLGDLGDYMEQARYLKYRQGEAIIPIGRICTDAYIVTSGSCNAVAVDFAALKEGKINGAADQVVVHQFTEGHMVVFKSLFRGEPMQIEVKAETDVDVLAIPRDVFEGYLSARPDTARKVEQILSAREEAATRLIKRSHMDTGDGTIREQRIKMLQDMFSE